MTDEELFKVYIKRELCANCRFPQFCKGAGRDCSDIAIVKRHYLAGVEAGKSQAETDLAIVAYMQGAERYKPTWHKVTDGDLPDNCRYVWTNEGAGYYDGDGWWDGSSRLQNVIAWCEPEFEE